MALRFLRIPATTSTKVIFEDQQNGSPKVHFDIRIGSEGMYDLMCWLVQRVRAHVSKAARRQHKTSRRADLVSAQRSPIRQTLAVQVLIRMRCVASLYRSSCLDDLLICSIFRNELRMSSARKALSSTDYECAEPDHVWHICGPSQEGLRLSCNAQ